MPTSPIDRILDEAVARDVAPGVVALAADEKGVFYQGARGRTAPDAATPVALDSVFRIASMTKAITSAAAMKLVEAGQARARPADGRDRPRARPSP